MARPLMLATLRPRYYRGFKHMIARSRALGLQLSKLRRPLAQDLEEHARAERSPLGPWKARKQSSVQRSAGRRARVVRGRRRRAGVRRGARTSISFRGGSKVLGQLPGSVVVRRRGGTLRARSPIPWSAVHNDPPGTRVGRGSFIPARPFVFLSPAFLDRAEKELIEHVSKGWTKR